MDHYQNCLYSVQNLIKEILKQMLKIVPSYNRRHDTVGKPAERIIYLCTEWEVYLLTDDFVNALRDNIHNMCPYYLLMYLH